MQGHEFPVARFQEGLNNLVMCKACMRFCRIRDGGLGICSNYENRKGMLINVGYGVLSSIESRPIEIKPLFHYWPGSSSLTFSNWGCNFYCPWCQNHAISFRRPRPDDVRFSPEDLVNMTISFSDEGLCASFNEPATQVDFLIDVFNLGRSKGLYSTVVTNGYFSNHSLEALIEAGCDGFSLDVKGCPRAHEKYLRGIDPMKVLQNARRAIDLGCHVEVVFLMVTNFNDDEGCVEWIVDRHLSMLGDDVPLHINRYFPAHKYNEPPTSIDKLLMARDVAKKAGIKFVYVGNVGSVELESTYCPNCGRLLIARSGYSVISYNLDGNSCPRCGSKIPIRGRYVRKTIRWRTIL